LATYDYADQQRKPGKHLVGIGIVVLMHILLGWALVSGLARKVVEVIKNPIETKIIEEVKPPPPPPENLPPPAKLAPPPPSFVPPPEVVVNPPPTPAPAITTTTVAPPPAPVTIAPAPAPTPAPPAPPAPAAAPPRLAQGDARNCAPTADDYPAAAVRAEATGTTAIRFTIDAAGKLVNSEVLRSAGPSREHRLLDRVAQTKLSECKFTPGRDAAGQPTGGSFTVEYVWKLQ
jgi:periplasmic protein TonB